MTDEEFAVIKTHPEHGQRLVDPLIDWLGPSAAAVWEHHEHWEGGGYPTGMPSEETALASRIVCVADAFDVMTSARSYKQPTSASKARAELERCAGSQFDPHVVRAMMTVSLGKLWGGGRWGPCHWWRRFGCFRGGWLRAGLQSPLPPSCWSRC